MKRFYILFGILLFNFLNSEAQTAISTTGAVPASGSMLDINSSNKGLLIPRVDLDDASTEAPVTSPATGLLIYNSGGDEPDGFYYWDGKWIALTTDDAQEVSDFQDTNQEPTGFISCGSAVNTTVNTSSAITDNNTTSTDISVSQTGTICDVNVTIDLDHTYDADLDISLTYDGTTVNLSSDNGGGGENYENTTFDDDASTSVTSGSAPFNGTYRPEESLSDFNGKDANGTWTLNIYDDAGGDTGTLYSVTLSVSVIEESEWEYVGEASVSYKAGSTPMILSYYSANPTADVGNKIRITRSTTSGAGDVGTVLAYSAAAPAQGDAGTLQSETTEFWVNMSANYHDDASLTDGTTYYYKLWKAGGIEAGQENYTIIPILINE